MNKEIIVRSSNGTLTINPKTGVVLKCVMEPDGEGINKIKKFNVKEFRNYYNYSLEGMPASIDILDLGYWDKKGIYEGPEMDWREEFGQGSHHTNIYTLK